MKKKTLLGIAVAVVLSLGVFALAGCSSNSSSSNNASSSDSGSSTDRTTFTVGFDPNFPPYGYRADDGSYTGVDLDMAAEVANRNGWQIQYEPIDWDAKDQLLNSGQIDCIWNGFTMEGREDGYAFTDPYMENYQEVVVRNDSGITSLDDLAGKTVETQVSSAADMLLSPGGSQEELGNSFKSIERVPDFNTAFMDLESGAVDAVVLDRTVANYEMEGRSDQFTVLDPPLDDEHYAVGFALGNEGLRDQVEDTLKQMTADGTAQQILNKYQDQGISVSEWIMPSA